jgi:hypothetical protein
MFCGLSYSPEDENIAVAQIAFRRWRHMLKRLSQHPSPKRFGSDVNVLTEYSFKMYGRRGWYERMEDTLRLSSEQQKLVEQLPALYNGCVGIHL